MKKKLTPEDGIRLARQVVSIFEDVFGKKVEFDREKSTIIFFAEKHGFDVYEFRLLIEHQYADESTRQFLLQPGRTNFRNLLHYKREEIILDIVEDLKQASQIQRKVEQEVEGPSVRYQAMKMSCCGEVVKRKFTKVFTPHGKAAFFWKADNTAYANHRCFQPKSLQIHAE